jgi:hypothetical protein
MLGTLAYSHLLMKVALTLQSTNTNACGMSGICLWAGQENRKDRKEEHRVGISGISQDIAL